MADRLDTVVALVTGGASGLGAALVEAFVAEGARVVLFDRNADRAADLARRHPKEIEVVVGDVTRLEDNRRAVNAAVDRFGALDVFVGNAGIWDYMAGLAQLSDDRIAEAFDEIMGVNVKGYLLGAKASVDALRESGRGRMVFTLSNAALYPGGGGPLYTASKHAGVGLVRQLAMELAPDIRVNAVAPGGMATDLRGPAALGQEGQSIGTAVPIDDLMREHGPLAFAPVPSDYVGPYLLLASPTESRAMTGAVIEVHGGVNVRR